MKKAKTEMLEEVKVMLPMNLQYFAGEGGDGSSGGNDDDNDDDEGDEGDEGGKDGKGGKDGDNEGESKKFTQKQLTDMFTKEKKQGRSSLVKELGFKNEKEMKAALEAYKKEQDDKKTEDEKKDEATRQLEEAKAELELKAKKAEAKVEAMKLGAKPDCVDDVIALAVMKSGDDDDSDFKTVIGEIKAKHAHMFEDASDDDDKSNKGKKGTGGTLKKKGSKGKEEEETLGERLAARRKPNANKKSAWS